MRYSIIVKFLRDYYKKIENPNILIYPLLLLLILFTYINMASNLTPIQCLLRLNYYAHAIKQPDSNIGFEYNNIMSQLTKSSEAKIIRTVNLVNKCELNRTFTDDDLLILLLRGIGFKCDFETSEFVNKSDCLFGECLFGECPCCCTFTYQYSTLTVIVPSE